MAAANKVVMAVMPITATTLAVNLATSAVLCASNDHPFAAELVASWLTPAPRCPGELTCPTPSIPSISFDNRLAAENATETLVPVANLILLVVDRESDDAAAQCQICANWSLGWSSTFSGRVLRLRQRFWC